MASRGYKRDSRGRFAGGGAAVKTTYGKAGGFANASFRARTANNAASRRQRQALVRRGAKVGTIVGAAAASAVLSRRGGSSGALTAVRAGATAVATARAYDIIKN